jgi:hypothetical protein
LSEAGGGTLAGADEMTSRWDTDEHSFAQIFDPGDLGNYSFRLQGPALRAATPSF